MQNTVRMWFCGVVGLVGISAVGAIQGCSSGAQKEVPYPAPLVMPTVEARRMEGGDVLLEFRLVGRGSDTSAVLGFVRNVQRMFTVLRHPDTGLLDTVYYSVAAGGRSDDSTVVLELHGQERWTNMRAVAYDSLVGETVLVLGDKTMYSTKQTFFLPIRKEKQAEVLPIELKGFVEDVTDSSAVFVVLATRHRVIREEYFPSSEHLRVIVSGENGIVWNSQMQQVFANALYPVEPTFVAEVKRYELQWNGRDNQGNPLPPGEYTAQLLLPTRPYPYSTVIPFEWKGGK